MGEKKVTVMILKVDLQCDCRYKKVNKVLCKFPEIRDWTFDEKSKTVTIKVISCDPEKIRCRLCRKGRGSIKSIEIKEPEEPKPPPKPPVDPQKPEKVTRPPPPPPHPKHEPVQIFASGPIPTCCEQCYGGRAGGPCNYGYGAPPVYYEGYYYGRIGFNGHGPNRYCNLGRCADYFSDENPTGCSVM